LKFCLFFIFRCRQANIQDSLIAGVADTAEKFISGVVDTGKQFFSGIVDTGDKFLAFWLFLTGEKCYRRCQHIDDRCLLLLQNYLRPPKSATAADIVIGTAMKMRTGTSQTLIRGPGGRQSYFKPKRHYLVLAASGASD
jgi:hypothetical protein